MASREVQNARSAARQVIGEASNRIRLSLTRSCARVRLGAAHRCRRSTAPQGVRRNEAIPDLIPDP